MPDPSDGLNFNGKVALVTGSSRGIGAGILTALAQRGARCVVNYFDDPDGRNRADAEKVAARLPASAAPKLVACDISKPDQVQAMADRIRAELGGLDILVNNAGIICDRSLRKMTVEEFESVIRVNLVGTFNVIKHTMDLIRPDGRVVNMASVAGTLGFFGQANYAPSKAGVVALTKVAARELARNRICVNAIAPGVIETPLTAQIKGNAAWYDAYAAKSVFNRWGRPDEIVGAAVFLASDAASYVTGSVVFVDGGWLAADGRFTPPGM